VGCGYSDHTERGWASLTAQFRHSIIDDRIEVHRATIGRELRRGAWQPEHDHANLRPYLRNRLDTRGPDERLYLDGQAQLQADTRAARSHQP
jgi:IS30 family transposase